MQNMNFLANYPYPGVWRYKQDAWKETEPGVQRRILAYSLTSMLVHYRIAPKSNVSMHAHPHAQFGFLLEGGGELETDNSTWHVKKGDSFYIPPGVKHKLTIDPESVTEIVCVFTPVREDYLSDASAPNQP
jgi:quercetin dioxygenase-like cupin family protein